MIKIGQIQKNSGMVFVTVVVLMVVFVSMGLGFLIMSRTSLNIAHNQKDALRSLYNGESAVQHSLAEILSGSDADGDGLGNIPLTDIDGDGQYDYSATYDSPSGMITGSGQLSSSTSVKQVQLKVTPKKWTGALQVGRNILISAPAGGTITGNVDAKGSISPNLGLYTVTGTVTPNNASLAIPAPTFSDYATSSNFSSNFYSLPDCTSLGLNPPPGVYYINGDCTISAGSTGPFVLNGSLIVTGTLTMSQITSSMTITPTGNNPAVVAGVDFVATSIVNATFNGLVYAGQDIRWTTFAFTTYVNNGALVAGRDINLVNVPSGLYTYSSSMDPPYFTGGSGVTVNYWKAHL